MSSLKDPLLVLMMALAMVYLTLVFIRFEKFGCVIIIFPLSGGCHRSMCS